MRPSTSRNQANGSTFTSSHEVTKLRSTAAVLPPLSLPKKVQLLRPTAKLRNDLSVALLSIARSPLATPIGAGYPTEPLGNYHVLPTATWVDIPATDDLRHWGAQLTKRASLSGEPESSQTGACRTPFWASSPCNARGVREAISTNIGHFARVLAPRC